jgi:hypothetical protein
MKKQVLFLSCILLMLAIVSIQLSWGNKKTSREFYKLTVYHFSTAAQENSLDDYFKNALLPALHRAGISKAGVFKSWANDTTADKLMYVLVPIKSLDKLKSLPQQLEKDPQYILAAESYSNADPKNPPYNRMETIVLRAFELAPQLQTPSLKSPKNERVYELRSYESATEKKFENKVKMFNQGDEIGIFKKLNFNPIFYSEVIAGSKMPNLMYMTSFENKADRDEHWKNFGSDPQWKQLSAMPEYQNNVSHIDVNFLYPTDYSDF